MPAQVSHRNWRLDHHAASQLHAHRTRFPPRRNDLREPRSDKMRRGSIVERERRWKPALDQTAQHRRPLRFAIIMRTASAAHQSKPIAERAKWHPERIGDAVLEPANRTRADSAPHDAC